MKNPKKQNHKSSISYIGLAYQLFFFLAILAFIGNQIDKKMGNPKAYVTASMLVIGLIAYLYKIVKQTA